MTNLSLIFVNLLSLSNQNYLSIIIRYQKLSFNFLASNIMYTLINFKEKFKQSKKFNKEKQ